MGGGNENSTTVTDISGYTLILNDDGSYYYKDDDGYAHVLLDEVVVFALEGGTRYNDKKDFYNKEMTTSGTKRTTDVITSMISTAPIVGGLVEMVSQTNEKERENAYSFLANNMTDGEDFWVRNECGNITIYNNKGDKVYGGCPQ